MATTPPLSETPQPRMLDYALEYAAHGIPVFPLHHPLPNGKCSCRDAKCVRNIGKHPRTKNGFLDATTDDKQIRAWWKQWPLANIGVPTGKASGWVVLDVDPRNHGDASLDALVGENGSVNWPHVRDEAWSAFTGGGGRHYLFAYPAREVKGWHKVIGEGLDIKADGGYIVVHPSLHPSSNRYEWCGDILNRRDIPRMPEWLLDLAEKWEPKRIEEPVPIRKPAASGSDRDAHWLDWAVAKAQPGTSDDMGFQLAQQLLLDPAVRNTDGVLAAYAQLASFDPSDPFTEKDIDRWLKSAQQSDMVRGGEAAKNPKAQVARPLPAKQERPKLHAVPTVEVKPAEYGKKYSSDEEPPTDEPYVRPQIVAKGRQLHEVTTDTLTALHAANNPPFMFQRSARLVRVFTDENQRPVIDEMDEKALTCRMTDVADFVRMLKTGKDEDGDAIFTEVAISPPTDLVRNVLAQPRWDFPALVGVTEAPFIRPDGSVCTTAGYDPATRLIYAPAQGLRIPSVPETPTRKQVANALATLDDVIADFPFDGDASRAHALALLLVAVTRPAIRGLVPLALVTAPAAGTGKSLLTSIAMTINSGRDAAMMVAADKEEEWTKRITATLLDGPSFVIIDNIRGVLKSPSLEGVLTTHVWKDRVLGASKVIELPQRAVWLATGNNIQLGGDMPRRCYRIRLDAQMARPERREGFRHPDIKAYVAHERGAILGALLTIARAWYADGCPNYPVTPMGTFEDWSHIVGCILAHAGVNGFLSNLDEMYEEADTERPQWAAFFTAWHDQFGTLAKTSGEVAAFITSASSDNPLRAALPDEFAPQADNVGALTKKLGYRLRELREIRYESAGSTEVFLASAGQNRTKTALWRVNQVPIN